MSISHDGRTWDLPGGYLLREIDRESLSPLLKQWMPQIFHGQSTVFPNYSEGESERIRILDSKMGEPFVLRLGLFRDNEFVGWHIGDQLSATEFYMRNSAVLPEHRGKGLYSAMLRCVVDYLVEMGFQEISSRHNTTNNTVIVPKLKQGFVITSLEVSDVFGTFVVLKYYANARRRIMMDVRSGMRIPEGEILEAMQRGRG
jgi:hypothetical protein